MENLLQRKIGTENGLAQRDAVSGNRVGNGCEG
jgi:hypothetical protein